MDDKWLERLEDKINKQYDRMDERLDKISETLTVNTEVLKVHEKRSDTNEKNLALLRNEFKPIQKHVDIINALGKIGTVALSIILAAKTLGFF